MPRNNENGFWPSWEDNKLFTVLLAILLVYGIVFLLVLTGKAYKESQRIGFGEHPAPSITVTGNGEASAAPDLREVDVTVSEAAATADAAQDAGAVKMNAIIAAYKELGIAEKDLQTTSYNVYPEYDYDVSPAKIVGYEATSTLTVTIRDAELVTSVLSLAADNGASFIGDVRLSIEDTSSVKAEARAEALRNAREEAEAIAAAMGAELGGVVSYYESEGYVPYYSSRSVMAEAADLASAPVVAEGESDVTVNVSVTYAIE